MPGSNYINIPQPTIDDGYNFTYKRHSISSASSSGSLWEEEGHQKQSSTKAVNIFIGKLFSMVNDLCNQHLISWSSTGNTFFIYNAPRFSQEILPIYFKHSNYSSFVRQLNMYGFHKINKSPRGQRGNNEFELWEFSHPRFQKDRPDLLEGIKRKAMDTEILRRENNDIHTTVATMQSSQADLLHRYKELQNNYSNLLQNVEEMKKTQLQQQILIKSLMQKTSAKEASPNNSDMTIASNPVCQYIQQSPQLPQDILCSSFNQDQLWYLPPSPVSSNHLLSPSFGNVHLTNINPQ
jgi:hypothetical protein